MTGLDVAVKDYLALRRAFGYKLKATEYLLRQFVRYLEDCGAPTVTTEHALAWARGPENGDPSWWALRLSVVRGFATYLQTIDPVCEVPPRDALPRGKHRATPYLYSGDEIGALLRATDSLRATFRAATYRTLIGLLATTGMRVGEAIRLDVADVDLDAGVLTIRLSKFGKTREVPLHETSVAALRTYLRRRNQLDPWPRTAAVFVSAAGTRLCYSGVRGTFQLLARQAGLAPRSAGCRPRLHDLRHSFAVHTLLDAYRNGLDVQERLALLSTYLGHSDPAATYWYLSAAPELLGLAAVRLDQHEEGGR